LLNGKYQFKRLRLHHETSVTKLCYLWSSAFYKAPPNRKSATNKEKAIQKRDQQKTSPKKSKFPW